MNAWGNLSPDILKGKSCFIGFDAFIDYITKPVLDKSNGNKTFFKTVDEFAGYLLSKKGLSFSIELETPKKKLGGNNPITCDIISSFGVKVTSAGPYGVPSPDPMFQELGKKCELISFSDPGVSHCYEFTRNKMLNYYNMNANDFTYQNFLRYTSEQKLIDLFNKINMALFLNISEQPAILDILKGLTENILPAVKNKKTFFLDLADCSCLQKNELENVIAFIKKLQNFGETILSANENEFKTLFRSVYGTDDRSPDFSKTLELCRTALSLDTIIVRTLPVFFYRNATETITVDNRLVETPVFITGAGDAQNAGICLGLLSGFTAEDCLKTGVETGNAYMKKGFVLQ
jgi:hypothetical protein